MSLGFIIPRALCISGLLVRVSLLGSSSQIRRRNALTKKSWLDVVHGLGKVRGSVGFAFTKRKLNNSFCHFYRSLLTAYVFPVVAFRRERSDDRKYVCGSRAIFTAVLCFFCYSVSAMFKTIPVTAITRVTDVIQIALEKFGLKV